MLELTEDDVIDLARRLQPHLTSAAQHAVDVVVARMHRLKNVGEGPLAYADLTFRVNGLDLGTIPGFKLIRKAEGGVWLAVPQKKSDVPNADGTDKYLDNFKWGNEGIKTQARRVVKDHYDKVGADA